MDWQYAEAGIFCLAPEIGTWEDFFWPPKSRIVPLAEENMLAISHWTWIGGSYVRLADHALADANGDGFHHPGEPVKVYLTLRNKGFAGTVSSVTATISSSSPHVSVINDFHDYGVMASLANADNSSDPMKVILKPTAPYGEVIDIDVDVAFDGYTVMETVSLVCGVPEILYSEDMETLPGWTVGDTGDNATTGIWTRANPIGTMFGTLEVQPENDHTPLGTRCYVTGNGSSHYDGDDVDNGKTTLKTAVFDLGERKFPLGYDYLLAPLSITPNNGEFHNFVGYLDGTGYSADPEFKIPNMPVLKGVNIHFAAAMLDVAYPYGMKNISAPFTVTVQ
jgi:hypothetical protein